MRVLSHFLFVLAIFSFIVFQAGNNMIGASSEQDLKTLVSILNDEHILITDWSLYSREKLEDVQEEELVAELKAMFPDWTWSGNTARKHTSNYEEKIKITSDQLHTYVMYEVKGQSWDNDSEAFVNKQWQGRLFDIFRGNATTFSCIKAEISDKMNKSLPYTMERLLVVFDAEKLEALEEDMFISTSAYSPLLTGVLSEDHEMNLQLGLRKQEGMGGNTTLVVGTPIITIEY
ncbi:YwmB family TATA-box binding protein [Bacillus sp. B15-48]|uniref:YwmB family TATA-box binding protein n=1 Tax=Bacillus sp. B15-48 TaxID=1548601 RepID=UPI00193F23C5|nr:YwmB family TATA-box binding protein [Bacillus sp. B15-48]MBM4761515.1 hypothetical protein [Bacillus sp. B15-48]